MNTPLAASPAGPGPSLFDCACRPDLGILVCRWHFQPEPAQLPAAYAELAETTVRANCRFWLQDIRRRTLNDPATTSWLLADYFPALARRLGGPLLVAYLVGPELHARIRQHEGVARDGEVTYPSFVVNLFGDEGAAIRWLQERQ